MAACVELAPVATGQSVQSTVYGIKLPAQPPSAQCQFVLVSGAEYSTWNQVMYMSPDDALVIGSQIAVLWAVAWGFRAIRMAISSPNERYDHE